MTADTFRTHCLSLPGVTEGFPFGEGALVFKVGPKMFALLNLDRPPLSANLKSTPEEALDLRERYADILPGYHMNKRHWNTVLLQGEVPNDVIEALIGRSYELVRQGLPRREREALG